jgi:hypothetical protein
VHSLHFMLAVSHPGFALPATQVTPSVGAPLIRASDVNASISSHFLDTAPRAIIDQGETQCCVSCALGAAMEIVHRDWPPLAPLFHYYVTANLNHGADANGFLRLDDALATLTAQGICSHINHDVDQGHAYTTLLTTIRPSPLAFADGAQRVIRRVQMRFQYQRLAGPSWSKSVRNELRQNRAIVIGFRLPTGYAADQFLDARFEWNDLQRVPPSDEGHCVVVTGYDDSRTAFRIVDSQGVNRVGGGIWWMAYRVADSGVIQDACSLFI